MRIPGIVLVGRVRDIRKLGTLPDVPGAIYWSRIDRIHFANPCGVAASYGFSDDFIYVELGKAADDRELPMVQTPLPGLESPFAAWADAGRKPY